jgi:hypothetical protein
MQLQRLARPAIATATLVLSSLAPVRLSAQVGVAARASTLGLGAELSYRANRNLGLRADANYLKFSKDATIESIDYTATLRFESALATVDLYPFGGSFHFSGGMLLNRNEGRLVAQLNQSIEIGSRTYAPAEVGSLIGTVNFKRTAPYLGLGFAGRSRVALLFDVGVGFTGTPRVNLVGQTPLTGVAKTQFDANVAEELAQLRSEIDGKSYLKYHPVVSLGFKLGF